MFKRYHLIALAVLLAVGSIVPAAAHTQLKKDPNDARSRLDVKSASLGHNGRKFRLLVETHETWRPRLLRRGGALNIRLWTNRRFFGHSVQIRYRKGRLQGKIIHYCSGQTCTEVVGRASVSKTGAKLLRINFQRKHVQGYRGRIRWAISTSQYRNCGTDCLDDVPNTDFYFHKL